MGEVNKVLINNLFESLEKGIITLEKCKQDVLKEIDRAEREWELKMGDLEELIQSIDE